MTDNVAFVRDILNADIFFQIRHFSYLSLGVRRTCRGQKALNVYLVQKSPAIFVVYRVSHLLIPQHIPPSAGVTSAVVTL